LPTDRDSIPSASRPHAAPALSPSPRSAARAGFTIFELLVVISIVTVLNGILMPVLSSARSAAGRVRCMSNMRQIGCGLIEYAERHSDDVPRLSVTANRSTAQWGEAMALTSPTGSYLDGLGLLLFTLDVTDPRVFYCPCHMGDHPFERYQGIFETRNLVLGNMGLIYGNYHYRSHMDPTAENPNLSLLKGRNLSSTVLVVDGMRTRRDFNHGTGTNRLKGDGSVDWHLDHGNMIYKALPLEPTSSFIGNDVFIDAWRWIDAKPQSDGSSDGDGGGGSQDE